MVHFVLEPTRFLGNNGTRERGPSLQVLSDEREALLRAMEKTTETGEPQVVTVDKEKFIVKDPGRVGREIKPLG